MDSVCQGLEFAFVYVDNSLVASTDADTHKQHLRLLLQRLHENGLVINPTKCQFGKDTLDFLGHHITHQGIAPLPDKVEAITKFTQPRTLNQLQELIGVVKFCRFLLDAAQLMLPLFEALERK